MKPLLVSAAISAVGVVCLLVYLRGAGVSSAALLPAAVVLFAFLVGTFIQRCYARGASRLGRWRRRTTGPDPKRPPAPRPPRRPRPPRGVRSPAPARREPGQGPPGATTGEPGGEGSRLPPRRGPADRRS
jgi:phage tail tape-measure protein